MEKMKAGIIGLGDWGRTHMEALQALPHVEIAAVCDQDEEKLHCIGDQFNVAGRYQTYMELLARENIDLVHVVTFEDQHLDPVLQALRAGKHVLVEKPVSTSREEAELMYLASREYSRLLLPGHLLRFDHQYGAVRQMIEQGEIGSPLSISLKRSRRKSLFATYQRTHTVYELMVHDIDLAIWYAGSRVIAVKAYARHAVQSEIPDILWAVLEFDNGAVAVLHSNWRLPDKTGIIIADSVEVIGSNGVVQFETANGGLQLWNDSGRSTPNFSIHNTVLGQTVGALKEQFNYIYNGIRTGSSLDHISFPDAIHGIEVADAIIQAAASGEAVLIKEVNA